LRLRERQVSIDPDTQQYIDALAALMTGVDKMWQAALWHLRFHADKIGEPIMGSAYTTTITLNKTMPVVSVLYKLSEDTVQVLAVEIESFSQATEPSSKL
jgi:hypothetical protein